jgi:hypothetical protein
MNDITNVVHGAELLGQAYPGLTSFVAPRIWPKGQTYLECSVPDGTADGQRDQSGISTIRHSGARI